jgi:hypothetical protein
MNDILEQELRGRIAALESQRNRALTDHVLSQGSLWFANAEKKALEEQNAVLMQSTADLSKRVAELEAKAAEPKEEG